jgi:membrane protein
VIRLAGLLTFPRRVLRAFFDDECPVRAAALAYYAVFAFPAVVALLLVMAGAVWDPEDVVRAMSGQFGVLVGSDVGNTLHEVLRRAERPGERGIIATVVSVALLLFGATGALGQLQAALNNAWEVMPDPRQGGVRRFIVKRFISALLIVGLGALLIASLLLSTIVSALSKVVTFLPRGAFNLLDVAVSFAILTVTFAGIFKILPDAEVEWKDVWIGAAVTTAILVGGKFAVGFYLGRSEPGSAYGAAGALAAVFFWAYFAAMTILLGAEATQAWVTRNGRLIRPQRGAIRMPRGIRTEHREALQHELVASDAKPHAAPPQRARSGAADAPKGVGRIAPDGSPRHLLQTVRRYPRGATLAAAGLWWLLRRRQP